MGKASRWLRSLWGSKKSSPESGAGQPSKEKKKGKWAVPKIVDKRDTSASPYIEGLDGNKHAIAVAAATAAVAEAALAAAQAAAEVVRLTNVGGSGSGRNVAAYISSERRRVSASITIQSAFRAYLARRALRALKGLVKLQALVRGHIVRKQSANMLRRMQAMARIQARASAQRSELSAYPTTNFMYPGVLHYGTVHQYQIRSRNWLGMELEPEQSSWCSNSHESSDKILEIDTWRPRQRPGCNGRSLRLPRYSPAFADMGQEYSKGSTGSRLSAKPNPSISSEEAEAEQKPVWTADNSPRVRSASSSRQTSNVASLFGDYLYHPSYMANTESSKAKVRSMSVPKQRMMQMESLYGTRNMWDYDCVSEKGSANHGELRLNHGYLRRQGSRAHGLVDSNYGYRL